jgi:hypothetical protein
MPPSISRMPLTARQAGKKLGAADVAMPTCHAGTL